MSTNQFSIEKKANDLKITSFAFLQVTILLFAPALGLWILRIMRASEIDTNKIVTLFQNLAIGFTVGFVIALAITLVTHFIYLKYKKELDSTIDSSIAQLRKNNNEDKKPRININLNQAPVNNPTPQKSVVQINTKPAVAPGPVKKVVTTTTTTTRPNPTTAPSARPGIGPRPMGPTPPGARPGMGARPTGPTPPGARPGIGPRPMGPMSPAARPGMGPRPGVPPLRK